MHTSHPGLGLGSLGLHDQDRVTRPDLGRRCPAEGQAELGGERVPVLKRVRGEERELAGAARRRVAVDGDTGAVRAAIVHLLEHRGQARAERFLDLRRFCEEADDATHMFEIYMWKSP